MRYFLRFTPADPVLRDRYPVAKGVVSEIPPIRYFTDEIKSIPLLRWLSRSGFLLGGWRGRLFLSALAILGIALVVITAMFLVAALVIADTTRTLLQYGLGAAMAVGLGWASLGWAIRLVQDGCALAPEILQPFSRYDDYLLELRPRDGVTTNAIYLARYSGTCSICGGHVHIESGRRAFSGRRLVGRCRKAPNAHVFSFDHETRWGRFLR